MIELTQDEFELLQPHEETLMKVYNSKAIRRLDSHIRDLIISVYKKSFPGDIINTQCSSCIFKVVYKVARAYSEYEQEDRTEELKEKHSEQKHKKEVTSADFNAKEAITYINDTDKEELQNFLESDEERVTVIEAYNDKMSE